MHSFKAWFVVGILRVQKWFDLDVSDFEIELWYCFFGNFWLGKYFGNFYQNLDNFFPNLLVTLITALLSWSVGVAEW